MRIALTSILLLAAVSSFGVPLAGIVDPRPRSAVVDQTGTLGVADIGTIDSLAARSRLGGEIVVVVIDSVGGAVPRAFTTQLFNRWHLDSAARNRGVLLLVALKDRKAEIVLGKGYPPAATRVTDRVMSQVLVPRFKAGAPRQAILEGAKALVDGLILVQPTPSPLPLASHPAPVRRAVATVPPPAPASGLVSKAMTAVTTNPLPVAGGVGSVLGAIAMARRYRRRRPRTCPDCSATMVRLDEVADDAHLTSGEVAEEGVGSVDYDVWACPGCRNTLKLRYGALFTSYATCPGCGAKTLKSTTTTIESATTSSEGLAQIDEQCAHCSHSNSYTRTIPRVVESSSSSSDSSSDSSSGGSSSGSGSSGSW